MRELVAEIYDKEAGCSKGGDPDSVVRKNALRIAAERDNSNNEPELEMVRALFADSDQRVRIAALVAGTTITPNRAFAGVLAEAWPGFQNPHLEAAALAITVQRRERTLVPWVCAVLAVNAAFFLILLNFVSNPFEKLPPQHVMSDGNGMNPLLQHPVMMIHPLVLYAGMTGFSVPFAFALAALLSGQLGTTWMRVTRRWTLWAWCILSIGILLGGRWAYEVLGWGGCWAWDPVENASFMPWLAATAYLHSVMVQEKRDMLKVWNFVLIGLTYGLCLFGTIC